MSKEQHFQNILMMLFVLDGC